MIDNIGEFFLDYNARGELIKHPSLLILDLPKESDLKKGNLTISVNPKQVYVFATTLVANGYIEIKTGTIFDILFPNRNTDTYVKCDVVLKYVNMNPSRQIDTLYGGCTALCLLEFSDELPKIMDRLGYYEQRDFTKHDRLILTQQEVFNALLEQIKSI